MKTNASFVYLTATGHVVSAFTRNGAPDEKLDEEQLFELLAKDLRLRLRFKKLSPPTEVETIQIRVSARELSVLNQTVDDPFREGAITRPLKFQVEGDVVKDVAKSKEEVNIPLSSITYEVKSNGVSVTLTPPGGKPLGDKPIKIWAMLRLGPNGIFDSGFGEVPGKTTNGEPSTGTISFASIPAGATHQILLMIQGLRPTWNQFDGILPSTPWP